MLANYNAMSLGLCTIPRIMQYPRDSAMSLGLCTIPGTLHCPRDSVMQMSLGHCTITGTLQYPRDSVMFPGLCTIPGTMHYPRDSTLSPGLCNVPGTLQCPRDYVMSPGLCNVPETLYRNYTAKCLLALQGGISILKYTTQFNWLRFNRQNYKIQQRQGIVNEERFQFNERFVPANSYHDNGYHGNGDHGNRKKLAHKTGRGQNGKWEE